MVRKALIFILILIPFSQLAFLSVANRVHPIIIGLPFFISGCFYGSQSLLYVRFLFIGCRRNKEDWTDARKYNSIDHYSRNRFNCCLHRLYSRERQIITHFC